MIKGILCTKLNLFWAQCCVWSNVLTASMLVHKCLTMCKLFVQSDVCVFAKVSIHGLITHRIWTFSKCLWFLCLHLFPWITFRDKEAVGKVIKELFIRQTFHPWMHCLDKIKLCLHWLLPKGSSCQKIEQFLVSAPPTIMPGRFHFKLLLKSRIVMHC